MRTVALAALALALSLSGCISKEGPAPVFMSAHEVSGLLANDFGLIVDLREDGPGVDRIAKAVVIPESKLVNGSEWDAFVRSLPQEKMIVMLGTSEAGARSSAEKLSKSGFRTAFMKGIEDWRAQGLPLVSSTASGGRQ